MKYDQGNPGVAGFTVDWHRASHQSLLKSVADAMRQEIPAVCVNDIRTEVGVLFGGDSQQEELWDRLTAVAAGYGYIPHRFDYGHGLYVFLRRSWEVAGLNRQPVNANDSDGESLVSLMLVNLERKIAFALHALTHGKVDSLDQEIRVLPGSFCAIHQAGLEPF